MEDITSQYSTITYNNNIALKTNSVNIAASDAPGAGNVKFSLEVSTSDKDTEGNKIFGIGDCVTYIINLSNFNDINLTGVKPAISGWNSVTAIPIILTLPSQLKLKDYPDNTVDEGAENPYVVYTENGVNTQMIRVMGYPAYESATNKYAYRIIDNTCTFLLPNFKADTSAYITFVAEANGTIEKGSILEATATLNFAENDTGSPLSSEAVSVKYSYVDLSAEKKAPAYVYYGKEFTYQIVMTNNGNLPAKIDKISDLLPDRFTVSTDENSKNKVNIKLNTTPLVESTDYELTVKTASIEITPISNALDISGGSTLTIDIIGSIEKSD